MRSTVLREGNFDYVTNQVRWDTAAQTLPASLYLTSKPAFFGSLPWPWVDPTGTTKLYTLPAKARYDSGSFFLPVIGSFTATPVLIGRGGDVDTRVVGAFPGSGA